MITQRRLFLKAPALLGASCLLNRMAEAAPAKTTFDEFARIAGQYAKEMISDPNRNEDEYLYRIATLLVSVERFPSAEYGEPIKTIRGAMSYRGSGIAVIQWRMEPNTVYPAHNHPGYNGLSFGLQGECRMRNFDVVGSAPDPKSTATFLVRETQDTVLRPGTVTSLMSTARDNIHELHAGEDGIVGVDVIAKVGADTGFSYLNIAGKAKRPQERVYEAAWGDRSTN